MVFTKAQAKSLAILDVARSLGMNMKRDSRKEYYWTEHDSFKIDTVKNTWHWYSRGTYGDTINLVQEMQKVNYKDAMHYLETGSFPEAKPVEEERQPFQYRLAPYEQPFREARAYLKEVRGLSDQTIDFFLEKGVLAQARRKAKDGYMEDVLVFKYLDRDQSIIGASLQGLTPNQDRYEGKGYLKQIMYQSQGIGGLNVAIGTPKRLVVAEAPIDLMSYYELHKDDLTDVRLVAMEGLKEGVLSRYTYELFQDLEIVPKEQLDYTQAKNLTRTSNFLSNTAKVTTVFQNSAYQDLITLAVDNDKAGHDFISKFLQAEVPVKIDVPPIAYQNQKKADWNEYLNNPIETDSTLQHVYSYNPNKKLFNYEGFYSVALAKEKVAALAESNWVVPSEHQLSQLDLELVQAGNMGLPNSSPSWPDSYYATAPNPEEDLQVTFLSSDNAIIQEHYSPGDIIPYDDFTKVLYAENLRLLQENPPETSFPATSREANDRTWFNIMNSESKVLPRLDKVAFIIGREQESISNRLSGVLPAEYLEPARAIDAKNFSATATWLEELERNRVPEPEIEVNLYKGRRQFATIDFADFFNNSSLQSLADEIGEFRDFSPAQSRGAFYAEINGERLTQEEVDKLIDRLFDEGVENEELAQMLAQPGFRLKEYALRGQEAEAVSDNQKAPGEYQEHTIDRTSGGAGSLQSKTGTEGSAIPEAEASFERSITRRPTSSYPYLHFNTNYGKVQRRITNYHPITPEDLKRLNQYAPSIQNTARWYLEELADSKISYVYADRGQQGVLEVSFLKDNFIHLAGIRPIEEGKTAADFLEDFARGHASYDSFLISHGIKSKLQILPTLQDILDPQSFVLDDLSGVAKLHKLDMSEAIKSKDTDFLLLFKDTEQGKFPASLMKLQGDLKVNTATIDEKVILGIYRERAGEEIEQLVVNEQYVKDNGQEILESLRQHRVEEVAENNLNQLSEQEQLFRKDSDGDGISDEEELLQGTNPYDFRSTPSQKAGEEISSLGEVVAAPTIAEMIQKKDMDGINQHLKEGIKEYLNSDRYKEFLTKMSQLNQYSSRNLRLILAQNPDVSLLASYNTWKKEFGRYVKSGETALRVVVPITYVMKDANGRPILDKNGKPELGTTFRLKATVFDVSQTAGKELPKKVDAIKEQVTDLEYANLYRSLMAIAKQNQVTVRFEELDVKRLGYYSPSNNEIVIHEKDMSKSQIIKTLLHETAHSELHHSDNPQKETLTRSTAELQAESVAYVVASYYGIDTSEYSFSYLAGWSTDKEALTDLEAQLDIVQQEAKSLMERMDKELERLQVVQAKQEQHKFADKLQKFKEKSAQDIKDHQKEQTKEEQSKKEKGISK